MRVAVRKMADENHASRLCSLDDVPFSIVAALYHEMRTAKASGNNRSRGSRRAGANDSRRLLLTKAWLKIAEVCGCSQDVLARQRTDRGFVPSQVLPPAEAFKIICLLVPALDSTHAYLGMKESKLADAFVKALDLVPSGGDAQWLRHHKEREYRPQRWKHNTDIVDGNFATVLKAVLTDRCPTNSSLTIGKVWKGLDVLSKASRGRTGRIARSGGESRLQNSLYDGETGEWQQANRQTADIRTAALQDLIQSGTADEVSEISRIILKDVDIRLSEDVFFSWFHPDAKQHYTQIHDIHQLLKDCFDPNFTIGEASVQVGQYASVMLTMRPSRKHLDTICENLRGCGQMFSDDEHEASTETATASYFIMEPKLDGERLQLHKWKARPTDDTSEEFCIRTFSRRGNESSAMYAGALKNVVLSAVKAENIILDGEIMIWDDLRASWLRFEDVREVATAIAKRSVPEGSSYTVKYMVFDVLYVDQGSKRQGDCRSSGNMVIRLPLYQRRRLLQKLVSEKELPYGIGATAKIEIVGMEKGHDERELTQALQRYETLGYEGVIAKHPEKPYVLAERSLDVSIKLKPDYFDGGIQDLDVLILGAKYSASRGHRAQRAGSLSSFLIGVRADGSESLQWKGRGQEWEEKMRSCKWLPVGSVGTGYSDAELAELQKEFQGEWKPFNSNELPDHFEKREYASTLLAEVAKWIEPWKSVVVTVRAYEVNRRYFALRFPRVERINWDKPYYDVQTFSHLLDLDENKLPVSVRPDDADVDDVSTIAVRKRTRTAADVEEEEALKRVKEEGHMVTGGHTARRVIASAIGANVSEVPRLCTALQDTTILVIAGDSEQKERIEVQIHQLGGSFVQNFGINVDFIVCTNSCLAKVRLLKDRFNASVGNEGTCPIIRASWIEACLERKERVLPALSDVEYATRKLELELFQWTDRFGDAWNEDANTSSLRHSLDKVDAWMKVSGTGDVQSAVWSDEIETEVRRVVKRAGNIFDDLIVAVPETGYTLAGSVCLLKAFGAKISEIQDVEVTHLLVHSSVSREFSKDSTSSDPVVITEVWVRQSASQGILVPV